MEQVPATISRRKLALGGPAAVALSPFAPLASLSKLAAIAPVGAAAVLGGVHTNASALTFSTDEFANWYLNSFSPTAKIVAPWELRNYYIAYKSAFAPDWPSYTIDQVRNDEAVANDMQTRLGNSMRAVDANISAELEAGNKYTTFTYTIADFKAYRDHFYNLSAGSLNFLLQHKSAVFQYVSIFLHFSLREKDFESWVAKTKLAEISDDRRYLQGTTDDGLDEERVSGGLFGASYTKMNLRFGDKRALVERAELVSSRSFWSWIALGPRNTPESVILHGENATVKENNVGNPWSRQGLTTSDAYTLPENTKAGIDYYVKADIDKNGPFAEMTDDLSRRMLKSATLYVAADTGLVYESYVVTQLAIRAYAQGAIALTRDLINSKKIDLVAIIEQVKVQAEVQGAVSALAEQSRKILLGATGAITAGVLGAVVASAIVMFESKKVIDENKKAGKKTTNAADELTVKNRVLGLLTGAQTATQLAALGFINFAVFAPGPSADTRLKWIGGFFGLADLTGGISDYVTVFRAGTQTTPGGFIQLVAGTARITGAVVGVMSLFYKLTNWTFLKWTKLVNPLTFNTGTAAIAAFFYAFSSVLVSSQ